MRKIIIKRIAVLAVLATMSVLLKTFSITNGLHRISFFDTPLILAGIIAGPIWGMVVAFVSDYLYSLLSGYAYSFIMMFSALLWGAVGGIFYKRKVNLFFLLLVVLLTSFVTTAINTVQLLIWNGIDEVRVVLGLRITTMLIKWPITTALVYVLYQRVVTVILKDSLAIKNENKSKVTKI